MPTVPTRRFGRTELPMPVLSCGGMRYQHKWQDVPLSEVPADNQANLEATIRRAVEVGITHIETARGYGSSERQLGLVLPHLDRERLIVQTKIAPTADPQQFVAEFGESLKRLQLEHVDLLALHGINTPELLWHSLRPGGCLEAARELQARGLARHIGFSTHGSLDVILAAIRHEPQGGFDYINLHWYYINQQNEEALRAAAERDLGVFIISPVDKGGMLNRPSARLVELCRPLHPIVFNCLFCLARPEIHTLSVGASCPGDFDLQLSAAAMLAEADDLLPPIVGRLDAALEQAVGSELAHRFAEGVPPWDQAPGYMNMAVMLWLRNLVLAFDMQEYARMRYNLLGNGGHWFPGLGAAHLDTIDEKPLAQALAKSPFAADIRRWLAETHELLGGEQVVRLSRSTESA
jgi:predicted aldo/keto reductase-like oxidoreductase